jgi:hypothetical protein
MGLLPPPQEGVIPETLEMLAGSLSPQGAATGGLLALGTMAGAKGGKAVNQAFKTAQDEAMELAQRNATLPVEQGGLGLPSDNTAMDRARAMGFTEESFHGTKRDFEAFDPDFQGSATDQGDFGTATYSSVEPETSSRYAISTGSLSKEPLGANVIPLLTRPGNRLNIEGQSGMEPLFKKAGNIENWTEMSPDAQAKLVKELGFDSIRDYGYPQTATFNPSDIRSRFAAFDPMRKNEPDLLASILAGLGLGGLLSLEEEEQF